jgi:hypothetical protein
MDICCASTSTTTTTSTITTTRLSLFWLRKDVCSSLKYANNELGERGARECLGLRFTPAPRLHHPNNNDDNDNNIIIYNIIDNSVISVKRPLEVRLGTSGEEIWKAT